MSDLNDLPQASSNLPPARLATVLPLDYTEERSENSVLYFSSDWSELTSLLTDPIGFMFRRQADWKDDGGPGKCWQLLSPVTAIIRPGKEKRHTENQIDSFMVKDLASSHGLSQDAFIESPPVDIDAAVDEAKAKGAFLAEFAIDTRVLTITYWAPDAKPPMDFKDAFTKCIFGWAPGRLGRRFGTLHFDLEESKEKSARVQAKLRAELIVSCLLDRRPLAEELMKKIKHGDATFSRSEDGITRRTEPREDDLPGTIRARESVDDLPTIVVDGLDGGGGLDGPCPFVCCNTMVQEGDEIGTFLMGDVLIKCYTSPHPCPDASPAPFEGMR